MATVCCCAAVAVEINKTEDSQAPEKDLTQREKTCFFYRTLNRNAAISQLYFMDISKNWLRKSVMDTRRLTENGRQETEYTSGDELMGHGRGAERAGGRLWGQAQGLQHRNTTEGHGRWKDYSHYS